MGVGDGLTDRQCRTTKIYICREGCYEYPNNRVPQIIPDDPSTRIRDPGSRSLTPMFEKS